MEGENACSHTHAELCASPLHLSLRRAAHQLSVNLRGHYLHRRAQAVFLQGGVHPMELSPWLVQAAPEVSHGQGQWGWVPSHLPGFGRRGHRPRVLPYPHSTPTPTPAQAQRPAAPQLALKDSLPHEEKGEREEAVDESCPKWCAPCTSSDESCPKWCAPRTSTYQSPLQKTFRSTDTVGKWCVDPLEAGFDPWLREEMQALTTRWQ